MRAFNSSHRLFAITLLSTVVMSGCQVVSLKQQAIDVTIANERNSILTQKDSAKQVSMFYRCQVKK